MSMWDKRQYQALNYKYNLLPDRNKFIKPKQSPTLVQLREAKVRILDLEQQVRELNDHIRRLDVLLMDKDRYIVGLSSYLAEKDKIIQDLEAQAQHFKFHKPLRLKRRLV